MKYLNSIACKLQPNKMRKIVFFIISHARWSCCCCWINIAIYSRPIEYCNAYRANCSRTLNHNEVSSLNKIVTKIGVVLLVWRKVFWRSNHCITIRCNFYISALTHSWSYDAKFRFLHLLRCLFANSETFWLISISFYVGVVRTMMSLMSEKYEAIMWTEIAAGRFF